MDEVLEAPSASRSMLQGPLFAIGLLALFAGSVFVAVTLIWPPGALKTNVNEVNMTQADIDRSKVSVEELGPAGLYDEFHFFVRDRAQSEHSSYALSLLDAGRMSYNSQIITGGVIAGIGAVLAVVGLALPGRGGGSLRQD